MVRCADAADVQTSVLYVVSLLGFLYLNSALMMVLLFAGILGLVLPIGAVCNRALTCSSLIVSSCRCRRCRHVLPFVCVHVQSIDFVFLGLAAPYTDKVLGNVCRGHCFLQIFLESRSY